MNESCCIKSYIVVYDTFCALSGVIFDAGTTMKSVGDVHGQDVFVLEDGASRQGSSSVPAEISAVSHLLEQGKFCKELYVSLGVHPSDIGESSDEDVESILEEMSRLQTGEDFADRALDRNIDDILKEAESLLDRQHNEAQFGSRASNLSGENLSFLSCDYPQACSLSNLNSKVPSSSHMEPCSPATHSPRNLERTLNSTFTKATVLQNSESEASQSQCDDCEQSQTKKDSKDSTNKDPPHVIGTPLEVTYQRIHEQIRKEMDGSLKPHLKGDFPNLRLTMPIPGIESPCIDIPSCFSLEQEFLEERKRCLKLKADLDWLKKQHEREVAELRYRHEGQLLQVREECSTHDDKDIRVRSLEKEVESQERIITGYQQENEKMCAELKDIKKALLKLMALLKTASGAACLD